MPSATLAGRLTFGAGTIGMAFAATAGLTAPAQATVHHPLAAQHQHPAARSDRQLADPQRPAPNLTTRRATGRHLAALRPAALEHIGRGRPARPIASTAPPRISAVTPAQGAPGWPVSLAGSRFRHVTSVRFDGVSATFTVTSSTRIITTVPARAASGPITVTAKAGQGRSTTFTVTPAETLEPGETLPSADTLTSKDGHYTLTMRGNGNLIYFVTGTGHTLWSSGTAGHAGAYLTMLNNGNLVIYSASGASTLWSSKTSGHGPARLVAQTDGNLVVYRGPTATWASGSSDATLEPRERLQPGWLLSSGNGYKLTMAKNGNLVEAGPGGTAWSSKTSGHPGATLVMRADGNLVVRSQGSTLWASNTAGHSGATLTVARSGVVEIRAKGKTLWASRKTSPPPLALGKWPGKAGTAAAAKYFSYPYPHPPQCTNGGACEADKWAFYRGQCTSWVAYRLNQLNGIAFTNSYGGKGHWANAVNWGPRARSLKIAVNGTPVVGSIAWYGATKAAPDGHVAYVEKVSSPTSIVMSEMNYDSDNGFWVHTITKATGDWPTGFIHLADR
jgi:surface antigen